MRSKADSNIFRVKWIAQASGTAGYYGNVPKQMSTLDWFLQGGKGMTLKGSNYSKLFFFCSGLMLLPFGVDIDLNTCGNQNPLRWVEITRLLACDDVWYLVTKH